MQLEEEEKTWVVVWDLSLEFFIIDFYFEQILNLLKFK